MEQREIKFRAWDSKYKRFNYCDIQFEPTYYGARVTGSVEGAGDKPWQQYTGLKDRNGTEIYEGDILQRHRIESQFATPWIVGANSSKGINSYHYDVSNLERYLERGDVYEIVGNIYENPDLLK